MKSIFEYKQTGFKRVSLHLFFWISYISFFIIQYAIFAKQYDVYTTAASLSLTAIADIGAAYFTTYILIQKFLFKKKYIQFSLLFILSIAFFVILQQLIIKYINIPLLNPNARSAQLGFWEFNPFYKFINIYSVVVLFLSIKLIKFWFVDQKQKAELESKNKISEMALLKSQLNPHFLFNTLNNIDSLIMSDQQKASDAIIKLSDILRSVIYESDELVPLNKEIDYLKNYIDLQSLRLKNKDFVEFHYENACHSKKIAPMILIPFVENAFKHGFKNTSSPGIVMNLSCTRNKISFHIRNKKSIHIAMNKDKTPGVGLKNTRRRLELIYGEYHKLKISENDTEFEVLLEIKSIEK